jgi:hypothetical protein
MARKETAKLQARKELVLDVLQRLGGVATTRAIWIELNKLGHSLSVSQVYYALRKLELEGKVRSKRYGRVMYWYLSNGESSTSSVNGNGNGNNSSDSSRNSKPQAIELLEKARELITELMQKYAHVAELYDSLRTLDELVSKALKRLKQTKEFGVK